MGQKQSDGEDKGGEVVKRATDGDDSESALGEQDGQAA